MAGPNWAVTYIYMLRSEKPFLPDRSEPQRSDSVSVYIHAMVGMDPMDISNPKGS